MKFSLDVIMTTAEGSLERVLGKLRQRSFTLCSMTAGRTTDHHSIRARIIVEGTRDIEPAIKQLSKLYDVRSVAVSSSMEATVTHVYQQADAQEQLGLCASL